MLQILNESKKLMTTTRLRQKDVIEFKASQDYIMRSCFKTKTQKAR